MGNTLEAIATDGDGDDTMTRIGLDVSDKEVVTLNSQSAPAGHPYQGLRTCKRMKSTSLPWQTESADHQVSI